VGGGGEGGRSGVLGWELRFGMVEAGVLFIGHGSGGRVFLKDEEIGMLATGSSLSLSPPRNGVGCECAKMPSPSTFTHPGQFTSWHQSLACRYSPVACPYAVDMTVTSLGQRPFPAKCSARHPAACSRRLLHRRQRTCFRAWPNATPFSPHLPSTMEGGSRRNFHTADALPRSSRQSHVTWTAEPHGRALRPIDPAARPLGSIVPHKGVPEATFSAAA